VNAPSRSPILRQVVSTDRPSALRSNALIDSQSVKSTESGGPRDYDAGKKIKGRNATSSTGRTSSCGSSTPTSPSPT
jgi:hypothetical protein